MKKERNEIGKQMAMWIYKRKNTQHDEKKTIVSELVGINDVKDEFAGTNNCDCSCSPWYQLKSKLEQTSELEQNLESKPAEDYVCDQQLVFPGFEDNRNDDMLDAIDSVQEAEDKIITETKNYEFNVKTVKRTPWNECDIDNCRFVDIVKCTPGVFGAVAVISGLIGFVLGKKIFGRARR